MKIWFVTTGRSDVQLKTDEDWNEWYRAIKSDCYNLPLKSPLKPTRTIENEDEPYRIAPRALGMAYRAFPDEVWKALEFPLLKEFTAELKDEPIAQIIILLTDQSQIFDEIKRDDLKCPYWQDTCELQPIFKRYFQTHFPNAELVSLVIAPQPGEPGLDDWNSVLNLIRSKLKDEISVNPTTAYISHQASTPAISSAIQFLSLAQFDDKVRFLVSNEYNPSLTGFVESSSYLQGLRLEKAKKLLDRYDYSGVKELLNSCLTPEIETLLDASIQWNFAEFEKFARELKAFQKLKKEIEDCTEEKNWWWAAYEAAWLGVVRLEQGNTVEAMFHSFRALEGLISKWSTVFYPDDIVNRDGKAVAILSSSRKLPEYLLKDLDELSLEGKNPELELYGERLFNLFRESRPELQNNEDLKSIWKSARKNRNQLFHRLKGLDKNSLFKAWGMNSRSSWEKRLLNCLNSISDQSHFKSLKEASLMAQVHQELKDLIDQL